MFINSFVLLLDALGDFAPPPLGIPRSVFHGFITKNTALLFGFFIAAQTAAPAVETTPATTAPKLIVAQRKFNRWYVYFKGVAAKDNVGCGCKMAKSAMRYMHLLKARYGAVISQNIYECLQFDAARES